MGKFRVEVTESIRYFVDLEAEDEDQAREKAEEFVISNAERDKLNLEVFDRDTGNCFENPPNWENDIITAPVQELDLASCLTTGRHSDNGIGQCFYCGTRIK